MRRSILLSIIILLLAVTAQAAKLSGKVTLDGNGVGGVMVKAWPKDVRALTGKAPYAVGPSAVYGQFTLDIPPGQYYLLAESDKLFSYYGRNAVALPGEGLENVNLPMVQKQQLEVAVDPLVESGVQGQVMFAGKPVAGAVVFVYPDLTSELKGFGLGMAPPTGSDGLFEIPLSAGTYYLVARVRLDGGLAGPLKAGDLFGYLPTNPVVVTEGTVARVTIPVIEVPEKVSRIAGTLFGTTRISGRVVDLDGKPVVGVKALLYADPSMLDRPLYVSQPTGADGTFVLSFPEGGTYYLAARDNLGGTPAPGELYGRYQGNPDHSLAVVTGKEKQDVEITVEEVW